jgi:hypothetical protein
MLQRCLFDIIFAGADIHNAPCMGDLARLRTTEPDRRLTGMIGQGVGNQETAFVVDGEYSVVIAHDDSNSAPENRFYMGDGADRVLTPGIHWYATYHPDGLTTLGGNFGPGWYGAEAL